MLSFFILFSSKIINLQLDQDPYYRTMFPGLYTKHAESEDLCTSLLSSNVIMNKAHFIH